MCKCDPEKSVSQFPSPALQDFMFCITGATGPTGATGATGLTGVPSCPHTRLMLHLHDLLQRIGYLMPHVLDI